MNKIMPIIGYCTVPADMSDEDFDEWLQFELGNNAQLSETNPLAGIDRADILNHISIDY